MLIIFLTRKFHPSVWKQLQAPTLLNKNYFTELMSRFVRLFHYLATIIFTVGVLCICFKMIYVEFSIDSVRQVVRKMKSFYCRID